MTNKLSVLLLTVVTAAFSLMNAPAAPLTVAVYDFTDDARSNRYGSKVAALVTAGLATETNIVMLERSELNKALNEQAFGDSGMVSSDAAAKIGKITGVQVLVSGHVLTTEENRLVIIANIIGTESGRLFSAKVSGSANNLLDLTTDLNSKIAQTIATHTTNLISASRESDAARIDRIVKSVNGTNRPSVSVNIVWGPRKRMHCTIAEVEFGAILLKAGFLVVDDNSDRKPDIEITGLYDHSEGERRNGLFSFRSSIELKVQKRTTGAILSLDRQEGIGVGGSKIGADRLAATQAVDGLAERVLPLLAK